LIISKGLDIRDTNAPAVAPLIKTIPREGWLSALFPFKSDFVISYIVNAELLSIDVVSSGEAKPR
jgi:hypothetical protein